MGAAAMKTKTEARGRNTIRVPELGEKGSPLHDPDTNSSDTLIFASRLANEVEIATQNRRPIKEDLRAVRRNWAFAVGAWVMVRP